MNNKAIYNAVCKQIYYDVRDEMVFFRRYEIPQMFFITTELRRIIINARTLNHGCLACWAISDDLKNNP